MASGKNIEELIDHIIDGWNSRFGKLQKQKEDGQVVSEDDVRKVVMDTGQEIFESGVTMSAAEASGHKTDEIKEVFQKVTENKMAASTVVDGLNDDVQVNAIQAAALKGSSGDERDALVSSIKSDPDFAPANGGSGAESEPNDDSDSAMAGGEAEYEDEKENEDETGHQVRGGANSGSGQSDDPNSAMAGEVENETEDENETEHQGRNGANSGSGQDDDPLAGMVSGGIDDGKEDVMDHAKNVAKDMVGDNGAGHTGLDSMPAVVATDTPPVAHDPSQPSALSNTGVSTRPRRVGAPMPAATTVTEPAAPVVSSMIVTDKDGVSRDVISNSPAEQTAIKAHIAGGGTFAQVDQIAAIYASGDPVAIANWERFAAAGGGTITPITSGGVAAHPNTQSSSSSTPPPDALDRAIASGNFGSTTPPPPPSDALDRALAGGSAGSQPPDAVDRAISGGIGSSSPPDAVDRAMDAMPASPPNKLDVRGL